MKNQDAIELELRKELIAWGTSEESLTQRPVTKRELLAMRSREYLWHSHYNSKNVDLALSEQSRKQQGQEQLQKNEFRKFWNSAKEDTANRVQIASNVAYEFQQLYPQMASVEENTTAIVKLIQERGEVFSLQSVIAAYQTLCSQGQLWICPENCGLVGSELVRGKMLTSIKRWERVLEPVKVLTDSEKEQQRIAGLDSESYRREFLPKDDVPALILKRIESDIRQFCKQHPEYDPTPEGRTILTNWIKEQGLPVGHDSLEAAYAACKEQLHQANSIFDSGPSIPVRYNASTLTDHRKPAIPEIQREVTLEPAPTIKRVDMEKLLALPADEFQRVVNGTPGLRELLDGERS
jgi:hypothetical protein